MVGLLAPDLFGRAVDAGKSWFRIGSARRMTRVIFKSMAVQGSFSLTMSSASANRSIVKVDRVLAVCGNKPFVAALRFQTVEALS